MELMGSIMQRIWGTSDLITLKVILMSFGALAIYSSTLVILFQPNFYRCSF